MGDDGYLKWTLSYPGARVACIAWRFCRAGRTSGEAAGREIRARERAPQSPGGFSALARLYYLARPTKTATLRKLVPEVFLENFTDVRESERSDTFSPFRGSLSLSLSHAESNFKTNVWDQGNSSLNKGKRAACYFKAHEQDLSGENTWSLSFSAIFISSIRLSECCRNSW